MQASFVGEGTSHREIDGTAESIVGRGKNTIERALGRERDSPI